MARSFAAWTILFVSILSNSLVLRVCANSPATPSVNAPQQQQEEDCGCTDGFCPHHHHKAQSTTNKADEEDCTCRLSADNQPSISSSASVPAILPDPAPPLQTVSAQTLRFTECDASAWDEMPTTPPPRA